MQQRLNLPASLLLFFLLLVHVALWWVPVQRSLRFCDYAEEVHAQDGSNDSAEDLRYARWLRNAYLAAAGVSLAYAVAGSLSGRHLALGLCAAQWVLPLWLIWRQPEEVIVFIPPFAHLIATACALGFGVCLVCLSAAGALRGRHR